MDVSLSIQHFYKAMWLLVDETIKYDYAAMAIYISFVDFGSIQTKYPKGHLPIATYFYSSSSAVIWVVFRNTLAITMTL